MRILNILAVGLLAGLLGAAGSLYTNHGSLNFISVWNMVKSQDYRYAYMINKTECIQTLKGTEAYLRFDPEYKSIEVLCTSAGHNSGKLAYCQSESGRKNSLCN